MRVASNALANKVLCLGGFRPGFKPVVRAAGCFCIKQG